jgi:catechol 2,3-dioxygenase-like lactoylglutathione lyase family enzyme
MERVPGLLNVDHVAITVPDVEAATDFYCSTFGAVELYRLGPFDARELPAAADGRDWTAAHLNVPDARLRIVMLRIAPNLMLELFQYDRPADSRKEPPRNCDVGGHHLAFQVESLENAVTALRDRGLKIMSGPIEVPVTHRGLLRVQYFLDPWGNQLELVEIVRGVVAESAR